jgi:deoxyribodipyrimidine photo-lyase
MGTHANRPTRVIWWVKRDARLFDNDALTAAAATGAEVLPLYVEEPLLYNGPDWSPVHTSVYHEALTALNNNLRHYESALFVRTGDMCTVLAALKEQLPFTSLYAHQETGLTHTYARDQAVAAWCKNNGVVFKEFKTNGIVRGPHQRDDWQKSFLLSMAESLHPIPKQLQLPPAVRRLSGRLATVTPLVGKSLPPVSERIAHETLREFLYTRGIGYRGGVSSPLTAPIACSRLSIHLAWGTLSLRTVFQATEKRLAELPTDGSMTAWRRSLHAFQSRLCWHSHFVQRLEDDIQMEHRPLNAAFTEGLPVVTGEEAVRRLVAWQDGQTGFPAIDAAMRAYQHTGWLTFRSRAMLTSFAVHGLRLPWQTMIYTLAQIMADYVPGIHVSQVQMQTGITGINTIRVYSPTKQLLDHDKDTIFVKRWIPELASYDTADIVAYETRTLPGYVAPIIDFKVESKIMKDALYAIKQSEIGRLEALGVYTKHGSRKHTQKK